MLVVFIIGIQFRLKNLINGDEMVSLMKSTAVAFMGASSVAHLVETVKQYVDSKGKVIKTTTDDSGLVTSPPVEGKSESDA